MYTKRIVPSFLVFEKTMFRLDHPACLDFEQDINQIKVCQLLKSYV